MSFKLGNTNISELYVGSTKIGSAYLGSTKVYEGSVVPPVPVLPAYTMRLKFTDGITPSSNKPCTFTQVSSSPNIWDLTYENSQWNGIFTITNTRNNLLEVIGSNITNVTNMNGLFSRCVSLTTVNLFDTSNVTNTYQMFSRCDSLTTVNLFDTSNVTSSGYMFDGCTSLTNIPLFNTSNISSCSYMFRNCSNVQSGALALYQQMSTQTTPPRLHSNAFTNCGSNTTTGAAELAQIPSSWGGTGA